MRFVARIINTRLLTRPSLDEKIFQTRPISNLSIKSKTIQRIVKSAYNKFHSTETVHFTSRTSHECYRASASYLPLFTRSLRRLWHHWSCHYLGSLMCMVWNWRYCTELVQVMSFTSFILRKVFTWSPWISRTMLIIIFVYWKLTNRN